MQVLILCSVLIHIRNDTYCMLICLTQECMAGSEDKKIVALLSQRIVVGIDGCINLSSVRRVCSQIASLEASNAAVYSALHDELATVFCFFTFQETNPNSGVKLKPPTLLLVSRQLAQSKSV